MMDSYYGNWDISRQSVDNDADRFGKWWLNGAIFLIRGQLVNLSIISSAFFLCGVVFSIIWSIVRRSLTAQLCLFWAIETAFSYNEHTHYENISWSNEYEAL